uniref:Uncharacterized protein n=1 Tax=Solanum lycopersicum TaxID=4081 RepID=A0A3Q7HR81_SOLLC
MFTVRRKLGFWLAIAGVARMKEHCLFHRLRWKKMRTLFRCEMLSAELNLVFGCGKQQVALQNLLKFKQAAGTYFSEIGTFSDTLYQENQSFSFKAIYLFFDKLHNCSRFGLVNLGCSTSAHKDDSTNSHELTWNKLAATYQFLNLCLANKIEKT